MDKNTGSLQLIEITTKNWYQVCRITDTLSEDHKKCVAQNAYSIAQAYFHPNAWIRAIALGEEPIGFVMMDMTMECFPSGEKPAVFLWRFMIGGPWQKKGYARQAMDLLCEKYRNEGYKYLYTSCCMEPYGPYGFYTKYGFEDTGVIEEDEEVLKLTL